MALGDDEQVHGRLRVDVPDRDEALRRGDVRRPRGRAGRRGSRQAATAKDPLLGHRVRADAHERPDRRVDEERRVVVAVAAAGPVDEHDVRACRSSPASGAVRARARGARSRAPRSRFSAAGTASAAAVAVPGRGEYGKTCTRESPAASTSASVRSNAALVLGREADDHVARQVELAGERLEPAQVGRSRVAAPHRPQDTVVAGLERHVQVPRRPSASPAAPRRAPSSTWLISIELSRSRSSPGVAPTSRTRRGRS